MHALWPGPNYDQHIRRLRAAIGQRIYLVEIQGGRTHLGFNLSGEAYQLLDVIPFPQPDPSRGIAPHLLLLDDGRGVNLGRIARISQRPFAPAPRDILYQDPVLMDQGLLAVRRLSHQQLGRRSRQLLARALGQAEPPQLTALDPTGENEQG